MKTTVNVPMEVLKTGPDEYQFATPGSAWSVVYTEALARTGSSAGARAIVQAIDSGAFADPLPTAVGAHIYNPELKVYFMHLEDVWASSHVVRGLAFHTDEQVQSYGPFEVLYDPEAQS